KSRAEPPRGAVGARLEALVPPAALAAARDQQLLAVTGEVSELFVRVGVAHHGADRHRHVQVRTAAAAAVIGAAGLPVRRLEGPLDAEIRQRIDPRGGAQVDAAAVAAVAAVRAAEGHELLAAETGAAAPAVAGLHARSRLIDEFHGVTLASAAGEPAPGRCAQAHPRGARRAG